MFDSQNKFTLNINLYSSKNSKQIRYNRKTNRSFITKSNNCIAKEPVLMQCLLNSKQDWLKFIRGTEKPLKLGIYIYRKTKHTFDYINIVQQLFDCMTKCNYWVDDDSKNVEPIFLGCDYDKDNPRIYFYLIDEIKLK